MSQDVWDLFWADTLLPFFPRLGTSVVIFLLFWLAAYAVKRVICSIGVVRSLDETLIAFLVRTANWVLLIVGGVMALGTIGIDVSALVAGLGLTGFAVGFALKDIISNTLSGILIIFHKPFHVGDVILVTGLQGEVLDIDLRYTLLRAEGQRIYVPNSLLFNNPVTVLTTPTTPASV